MNTIILAQVLGISFSVMGITMLINKKGMTSVVESLSNNKGVLWLAGVFTVILGSVVVVLNNFWMGGLSLVVTIIGWLILIKGASILVAPEATAKYYKKLNKEHVFVWAGWIVLIIGLLLVR